MPRPLWIGLAFGLLVAGYRLFTVGDLPAVFFDFVIWTLVGSLVAYAFTAIWHRVARKSPQ